jgi:hypothetical protein
MLLWQFESSMPTWRKTSRLIAAVRLENFLKAVDWLISFHSPDNVEYM